MASAVETGEATAEMAVEATGDDTSSTDLVTAPPPTSLELLETACAEYSAYLLVDGSPDIQAVELAIEEMLVRMDEFRAVVETICRDSTSAVDTHVPMLLSKSQKLEEIYAKIDKLERFMSIVRASVNDVERHLERAEKDMQQSGIKKVFSTFSKLSFLGGRKATPVVEKERRKFQAPNVYSTEDFFTEAEPTEEEET